MSELRPRSGRRSAVAAVARHGRLKRSRAWLFVIQLVAITVAVAVVAGSAIAGIVAYNLSSRVSANLVDIHPGEKVAAPPGIGAYPGGYNVLIVGSDTGAGQGALGEGRSASLNDVNILLHVAADHKSATAISFPRDMVLPHPKCSSGGTAAGLPLNTALSYGGLACVVTVLEGFTGLPIQFAGLITFDGVIGVADAIGGVDVCVDGAFHDAYTGLQLPSGTSTLTGYNALAFLRSRHGVGDGSDLARISSQQVYLSSMVRKLQSSGALSNPETVYKIANAAISNMQLSTSLDSLTTMLSLAQTLKDIPSANIALVQYPGSTGGTGIFAGKVQPNLSLGTQLINLVKSDTPFTLGSSGQNRGSVVSTAPAAPAATTAPSPSKSTAKAAPSPTKSTAKAAPSPTKSTATATLPPDPSPSASTVINGLIGQSAAQQSCSKSRPLQNQ
jgi:LCP family protein required for cell wall assembly